MRLKSRLLPYYIVLLIVGLGGMYYLRTQLSLSKTPDSPRDYADISREGTLRLQATYNASERNSTSTDDLGHIQQLAHKISQVSGLTVDVVLENSRDKAMKMLLDRKIDILTQTFVHTSEIDTTAIRLLKEHFSGPLYLVQRRDSLTRITRQIDLAGKTITLPLASRLGIFVKHLSEEIGDSIQIAEDPVYDTEQLMIQIASKTIDYTLCTADEARYYATRFEDLDFSLPIAYSMRSAWVIRRESVVLADSLSNWLNRITLP